ncbi:hypothetical protein DFH11DRAFT_1742109 [Phellopilus nigrolimitatus]|nr:hypothetical protein DFH11DRAFT_1742109 [Phellopilus nigrolimitatus]
MIMTQSETRNDICRQHEPIKIGSLTCKPLQLSFGAERRRKYYPENFKVLLVYERITEKGNTLWHDDSTYNQYRSKYSILLAYVVPKEGGNTGYADERHALRDLPEKTKAKLRGLVVKHNLGHSRKLAARNRTRCYRTSHASEMVGPQILYATEVRHFGKIVPVRISHNCQVMRRATAFHDRTDVRDVRRTTVYDRPERYGVPGAASSN